MSLSFHNFEIDPVRRELRREGRALDVQPLVFDLLLYFARHPNVLVSKDALIRDVWKGVAVGDGAIAQAMSLARRTLRADDASAPSIHTVWGRGYRFVANVRELGAGDQPVEQRAAPAQMPFVGRAAVMALLAGALAGARRGDGRLFLLSGEPGIGKTRTCAELAVGAATERAHVFVAHVPETGGAPTYWPWAELVRQAIAAANPALRADPRTIVLRDALLPEHRPLDDARRELQAYEGERARFELFEQVASFWTRVAATAPLVLILDDVHRADVESLELLDFVVQRAARVPILFAATFRPPELRGDDARGHALGVLARRPNAVSERLGRLTRNDVAELVGRLTGEPCDEAFATALLDRSGGNPFLLKELLWLWLRRSTSDGAAGDPELPATLLPAIERHLDVVSFACRELLAVASVIGREFDVAVLAATSGVPFAEVSARVDEAVRAEVVAPIRSPRFHFVHALVRDAVYGALPTERRVALHARVGRAIEATLGGGDEYAEALAHHFCEAVTIGEASRALTYGIRAARVAVRASAFREAQARYRRAIEIAPLADADEETLLELQVGLTESAANVGDFDTVRVEARAAMQRARRLDDAPAFARAAHAFSLGNEADTAHPPVIQALEEALERYTAETPLYVHLLTRLANAQWFAAPPAVSRALAERAVEAGRRVGDPDALSLALTRAYRIFVGPAEYAALRAALSQEMLDLLPRVRSPIARLDCSWHALVDAVERGDRIAYDRRFDAMLREVAESPHPLAPWFAMTFRTARLHLDGRFADAEAEARRGLTLAAPGGSEFRESVFGLQMLAIRMAQGRFDEHLDEFRRSLSAERPVVARINLALGDAFCGRREDAERMFAAAVADDLALIPRDFNWPIALVYLADLCVALERADAAPMLLAHLMPLARQHVLFGASLCHFGSVSRWIGLLAEFLGRLDEAERYLRDGIERDARMGAVAFVALGRFQLAQLLRRRRGRGARAEATALLESVVADAERLDLRRLRAEAETLLGR